MVRFDTDHKTDSKSACSINASQGELMEIVSKTVSMSQDLHPITIITLLDKELKPIACKALLDHCCTDRGFSWNLAKMLGLPTSTSNFKVFITGNGTFSSNELKLDKAMLPYLSNNQTFLIEFMVVPKECCIEINYGVIIGQK